MVQKTLQQLKLPLLVFLIIIIIGSVLLTVTYLETKQKKPDILKLQKNTQSQRGVVSEVSEDAIGIDPEAYLTTWNFNNLPEQERKKYYRETKQEDGSLLREYWIHAEDKEIEIAPGVFFPAWTYNGQVPGPSIRATEGDKIKIYFTNRGTKPHSLHFHGFHDPSMDGSMPEQVVLPGQSFTYEFTAEPFGVHLYHCHGFPVAQHIHKGLYGVYIVDPKPEKDTRPKPDQELIMLMNGFDTNFDEENEVYAVNSIAFYYDQHPINLKANELVRIYLVNMLEFDQINSFHVHANFFDEYKTGTKLTPDTFTDITVLGQGERSIIDMTFRYPGRYMFHAHKTEFAEKGWMGHFEVIDEKTKKTDIEMH
ncbi:multicopper oxidase domain-containing protein [Candidatus Woesearchaeota archaeon]|nr:multicopper oxidase domain-containing protein [Candidatus Woesearchaeota archaeon]